MFVQPQDRATTQAMTGDHPQTVTWPVTTGAGVGHFVRGRRASAARAAVIAIAAMALLLPAGVASAATLHGHQVAAHSTQDNRVAGASMGARPAVTKTLTWHKLTLLHGWKPARAAGYNVGDPAYAISGGIVYLTGVLHQPSGSIDGFALLPKGARPAHWLYRTDVTSGLNPGMLRIGPTGYLHADSTPAANARAGTSLAGISYPVTGVTWHKLALLNAYRPLRSRIPIGKPAYAIKGGVVYLSGELSFSGGFRRMVSASRMQPSVSFLLAVLPKAARPAHEMFITVPFGDTAGSLVIKPNGDMLAPQPWTSLDALSYPAAGAKWHKIPLSNGWKSDTSIFLPTGDPAYTVISGVVFLSGALRESAGSSTQFASVVPTAARPGHTLYFPAFTLGGNYGAVPVVPGQGMFANGQPFSNAQNFTSLAGIAYPRTS